MRNLNSAQFLLARDVEVVHWCACWSFRQSSFVCDDIENLRSFVRSLILFLFFSECSFCSCWTTDQMGETHTRSVFGQHSTSDWLRRTRERSSIFSLHLDHYLISIDQHWSIFYLQSNLRWWVCVDVPFFSLLVQLHHLTRLVLFVEMSMEKIASSAVSVFRMIFISASVPVSFR